ncbi:hypothetical protein P9112_010855 [Eukaryota sp. TZLM1-RC]
MLITILVLLITAIFIKYILSRRSEPPPQPKPLSVPPAKPSTKKVESTRRHSAVNKPKDDRSYCTLKMGKKVNDFDFVNDHILVLSERAIKLFEYKSTPPKFHTIRSIGLPEKCGAISDLMTVSFGHGDVIFYNRQGEEIHTLHTPLPIGTAWMQLSDHLLVLGSTTETVVFDIENRFQELWRGKPSRLRNSGIGCGLLTDQSSGNQFPFWIISGFSPDLDFIIKNPKSKTGMDHKSIITKLSSAVLFVAVDTNLVAVLSTSEVKVFDLNVRVFQDESPKLLSSLKVSKFVDKMTLRGIAVNSKANRVVLFSSNRFVVVDLMSQELLMDYSTLFDFSCCKLSHCGNFVGIDQKTNVMLVKIERVESY